MEYTSHTVRCNEPGLSQEQALASLYTAYGDIRIAGVLRRGDAWVVTYQQKVADFPPKDDGAEAPKEEAPEAPAEDGPPTDAPSDGPPSDGPDDGGDKPDPLAELTHLVHEIAQALGIGGGLEDKLPPEGEHPGDLPPGPDAGMDPMGGPPAGPVGPAPHKPTKLKPGEVLPTQTPMGSPAFSSTKQASTITVQSGPVDPRTYKVVRAKGELEAQYPGYQVEQLKFDRTAGVYRALLSVH